MIRFSKMADYGVLLLGHFARNQEAMASTAALAETYHMPRPVVANLLKEFCKAGFLESRRGLHGGYRLSRPPEDITLLAALQVIDGPVRLVDCSPDLPELDCTYTDVCPSRSPLLAVNGRIVAMLAGISLAQLMNETASSVGIPSAP